MKEGDIITSTTEKIKMVMLKCHITQKELASKLGITQPTLSSKFKLDDWRESDLRKIADVCGCVYENSFKFNDGDVVK